MGKGMGRKPKERESVVERQKKLRQKEDQNVSISEVGQAVIDTSKIGSVDEVHEYSHNMIMRNNVFQQNRSVYRKDLQSINKEMRRQKRLSRRKRFRDNFSTIIKVFKYSKKYQYLLWLTIFFDLFCIFLELCIPVVLGKAIDCIVGKNNVDFSSLLNYSVLMCGLIAFAGIGKWAEAVCTNLYCIKTSKSVRELMFNKFNHVPLAVIDNHQHGDLLDRMVNDVEDMTNGFLSSIQSIFSGIVTIIGTIVFMFVLNTSMAFIIILVTPLSLLFTVFIARKSKKLFNRMAKAQGDISGHMEEYFSGQRIVKAFGHEEAAINEYDEINKEFYIVSEKAQFLSKLIGPITRFINGLVYGLVGLFGSIFAIRGMMSVGMISSFLTYSNSYGRPFSDIADQISDIQEAFAAPLAPLASEDFVSRLKEVVKSAAAGASAGVEPAAVGLAFSQEGSSLQLVELPQPAKASIDGFSVRQTRVWVSTDFVCEELHMANMNIQRKAIDLGSLAQSIPGVVALAAQVLELDPGMTSTVYVIRARADMQKRLALGSAQRIASDDEEALAVFAYQSLGAADGF